MDFRSLKTKLAANFQLATQDKPLFEVAADPDKLWEIYLSSFPEGANPMYRVRTEHDCSCCRHFIKEIGKTVYITPDLTVHSIFEFDTGSEAFQPVMDALAAYVTSCPIVGIYYAKSHVVGTDKSYERGIGGKVTIYNHLSVEVPARLVYRGRDTLDGVKARFRATRNVFKRSLDEISMEAIDTVLELIASNTLYKGAEWGQALETLRSLKQTYEPLTDEKKELFCWAMAANIGEALGRIRNHSIGVLLTDISEGKDLDAAVRSYEAIVAPANYKRPKAIFTKKMLEDAQNTITDLGYMNSLKRRFATLDDITVNNILFSNKDAAKRLQGGSVFDEMKAEVAGNPKQFSRVEEISIENFISQVLPSAKSVEAFVENRHAPNLVSLIAPADKTAKTMFKWNNGFSWAYAGNMTDSDIRENVKNAGGNVNGVLRFSIQWNDRGEHDANDLDAHCQDASNCEIYFGYTHSPATDGSLDVDIINPREGKPAVENITWPSKEEMKPGAYDFWVNCFNNRGGKSGFRAEIEFDGQIFRYDYTAALRHKENVRVAVVTLHKDGHFSIEESLPSTLSSRELWGIKTQQFVPVSVIMYSPNYWNDQFGIGHKHYMFMLKGCVNPEKPNGFYNEFLKNELLPHKRVLEALGSRMAVETVEDQLSGLGFSSTKRNELVVKVTGASERVMKIKF